MSKKKVLIPHWLSGVVDLSPEMATRVIKGRAQFEFACRKIPNAEKMRVGKELGLKVPLQDVTTLLAQGRLLPKLETGAVDYQSICELVISPAEAAQVLELSFEQPKDLPALRTALRAVDKQCQFQIKALGWRFFELRCVSVIVGGVLQDSIPPWRPRPLPFDGWWVFVGLPLLRECGALG